ncbi:M20 family metallopeptidase [Candidatus Omnitrophota bacterium]
MSKTASLLQRIDDEEVVQVASELVTIPSLTTHEGRVMIDYMVQWFDDLGIPYREYPTDDGRANFFADYGAVSGPGRFIFNGHMDTKPVDGMTINPFGGEIVDGRMYGRGACDMKSGIAAILCAFKALVSAGIKPQGGITFYSDIEEEFGGPNGMQKMIGEGFLDGYESLISCEPTNLEVHIGDKGSYTTCFETVGKTAHSGLAHLGVNAIQNMALFIQEYLDLPYLRKSNTYFGQSTVNFERIEGGNYLAAVPDRCTACLDSRLIPDTPPDVVLREAHDLMERLNRELGISIREIDPPKNWRPRRGWGNSHHIEPDHELTRRVARVVATATGKDAVIAGCPGATIAGMMIGRGTPSVICGPGAIVQAHTEDEWIEISQIPVAAKIYTVLMADM